MTEPGDRLGPGGDVHERQARRRALRRQRRQDVHHQRHQRRPRDRRGQDRHRPSATAASACWSSSAAWTASSAGATSRRSASTPRTRPSCPSPTCVCRWRTCSGEEGQGFRYLVSNLPQERLSIAASAVAAAEAALAWTLEYVRERTAFGQPIGSFQSSRFTLAELHGEVRDRARVRRPLRAGAERRRADRPRRPPPRSGGPPTCRAGSSTAACSCSAATATCSSTRSPAPSPTRA